MRVSMGVSPVLSIGTECVLHSGSMLDRWVNVRCNQRDGSSACNDDIISDWMSNAPGVYVVQFRLTYDINSKNYYT